MASTQAVKTSDTNIVSLFQDCGHLDEHNPPLIIRHPHQQFFLRLHTPGRSQLAFNSQTPIRRLLTIAWVLKLFIFFFQGVTRKARVIDVVYNASNNELVRTKTLVKNCIVQIDSTPFRQW